MIGHLGVVYPGVYAPERGEYIFFKLEYIVSFREIKEKVGVSF